MLDLYEAVSATLAETSGVTRPVSLVAIELDRIEALRSRLGSTATEQVFDRVSQMLARILRTGDYVRRIADGELLVVLLGAGRSEGSSVARRIGAAVRGHPFVANGSTSVADPLNRMTISAGVAATPDYGADLETILAAAREARDSIVRRGGDGVAVAPGPAVEPARLIPDVDRFAGHLEDRRTLFRMLEEATKENPRVAAVVGETGSGTLTLVRQLEPEVRLLGGAMVYGHARRTSVRAPYGVWSGVLRGLRRLPAPPDQTWRELPKLVPELSQEAQNASGTKYRLQQEISTYLRMAASAVPLVIVLDEMQWADEESWDALDYVLDHVGKEKLLICLTMRGGDDYVMTRERCATYQHRPDYQELQLSRLTRDEVKIWLEAALDHQEVGREFLSFAYRHTEGNPFSLTQLVRCVAEEGKLWHNGERWEWKPVSELRLPPGLTGVVSRRIERLSFSTQAVLSAAAIVGHEFDVELVAASGAGSVPAVEVAFDEALAGGMLQRVYDRRRKAFTFVHDSIVDVLTQTVSPDHLRQLHERVAEAIEARGEGNSAELALHYDAALSSAAAYRTALAAAVHAEALHAQAVSSEYLQVAARNSSSPAELAEVRVRLAYIAGVLGRYDEEEELCDLAIEWFEGQGDRRRTLTLRRMRERARKQLGQAAGRSMEALLALDEEAVALGYDQERVAILTLISQTHGRLGESQKAERVAVECVRIAEQVGYPSLLAEALTRLGITVEGESPRRAQEYYERALALAQASGDIRGQLRSYNNLGLVLQVEGQIDAARESLTMAISVGRAAGVADLWGSAALNLGVLMQNLGDYGRARELFSEGLDLFAGLKNSEHQLYALFNMADLERKRGEHASAADLYEATFSLARRIGQSDVEIGARAGEGLCLLVLHRLAGARGALAEAEVLMATRTEWFQGRELVETLRVLMAAAEGRGADALELFEEARVLAEAADPLRAAELTAGCADVLFAFDPAVARKAVARYAPRVATLGFATLTERYRVLMAKA